MFRRISGITATWLFYSAKSSSPSGLRMAGRKLIWLVVPGLLIVMLALVGVNLVIAGLHFNAGTD
ncbi:hypothetical protein KIH86_04470 [Paenibacillus sp. HN-1]|uniref:hypothetical protein n=1 Tax=Paenibacillus TaxID=44249 RepID=UPI001CA8B7FB|nr:MULTISPECIES: hypothetical protein [Paenibacillus]MBY9081614.1 hypothetical protein [Paenibacillus sp. CGMCC 1.18879]MBY9083483.1 hypothetical protein [Paenibacillus sinensis]